MKIKTDIHALIEYFTEARKKYEEAKEVVEAQKMKYTPVYLDQKRAELDNAFTQILSDVDTKLTAIFQGAIDKITARKNYHKDFKDSVSEALSYINAMGNNITDAMALDLVKPLLGDYQTMRRFYLVLYENLYTGEKVNENSTLFALSGYVDAVDMLKKIQVKYENHFSQMGNSKGNMILGNSPTMTAINFDFAFDTFKAYITREVDVYENHLDKIEAIYAVNWAVA